MDRHRRSLAGEQSSRPHRSLEGRRPQHEAKWLGLRMLPLAYSHLPPSRCPVLPRRVSQGRGTGTSALGCIRLTGAELRAHRKAAGLSQVDLAQRAEIRRHAVSYWECRAEVDLRGWAVRRMLKALGVVLLPVYRTPNARAGGWGLSQDAAQARLDALAEADLNRLREREAQRAERLRVQCGAKTRKGTACRNMSEPGRRRCKFHGGRSTGPRTPEGRARVGEAQRRRWAGDSFPRPP